MNTEKGLTKLVEVATLIRNVRPKMKADEELAEFLKNYRAEKQSENGEVDDIDFITALLPIAIGHYREELYEFLAIWNEKSVETIKEQPFPQTLKEIFAIVQNDDFGELKAFF